MIQMDKQLYYIDHRLAKQLVLVHLNAHHRYLRLTMGGKPLPKVLPLKDLQPQEHLHIDDYLKILQKEAMSIAYYRQLMWMQSGDVA